MLHLDPAGEVAKVLLLVPARLLSFVCRTHEISPDAETAIAEGTHGGIKGSHPVWGGYDPFRYPNWAAKFFADALMMDLDNIAPPPPPELAAAQQEKVAHV